MHGAKLAHRDLKLSNVLLGDNMTVKICDFGFSVIKYYLIYLSNTIY